MAIILIILAVLFVGALVVILYVVGAYNNLVSLRNLFKNAFAPSRVSMCAWSAGAPSSSSPTE